MTSSTSFSPMISTVASTGHESVLLQEAVSALALSPRGIMVDATVGGAGHFEALYAQLGTGGVLVGIDADEAALARAKIKLGDHGATVHLVHDNFRNLHRVLETLHIDRVDGVLFDLGWSGYQLSSGRGFSFKGNEPLIMTYASNTANVMTAADVVNSATFETLSDIIYSLGEERFARHIARGIVAARETERILTTDALVRIILASTPKWYHTRRIHPATKTFQALRMYVNDELGSLREGLHAALMHVRSGGRIAVITFHSIEDRVVKNFLRDAVRDGRGTLVSRKPIVPSERECAKNPRARSAKLRVFECGASS